MRAKGLYRLGWVVVLAAAVHGCGGDGGGSDPGDALEIFLQTQVGSSSPAGDGEIDVDPLDRRRRVSGQMPVVFIHGFDFPLGGRSPLQQMDDIMEDLVERIPDWDQRFQEWYYTYDPLKRLHVSATELAGELRRLGHQGPLILVAYSQGGLVARDFDTRFSAEFPVRLLVMVATPNGGLPLEAMKEMLLDDVSDPLPTDVAREVARIIYREAFEEREVSDDLAVGSPFLEGLAPPKEYYYGFAGVGSDTNLFLDYVSDVDFYEGLPNDGLVTVEGVEAGLIPGRTAEARVGEGYPDESHFGLISATPVVEGVAELLAAVE